jgi:uncharacterized protein
MSAYLDTSTLVSLIIVDANTKLARQWFNLNKTDVQLSPLVKIEFASAVSIKLRRNEFTNTDAHFYLEVFDNWILYNASIFDALREDYALAEQYVRRFDLKLRGPDVLHIAICIRLKATMITFDENQAAAARALGATVEIPQ